MHVAYGCQCSIVTVALLCVGKVAYLFSSFITIHQRCHICDDMRVVAGIILFEVVYAWHFTTVSSGIVAFYSVLRVFCARPKQNIAINSV